MKSWMHDNNKKMYSANNEGKFVVGQSFITTLKNKITKHMTSISKNVYIDKSFDVVKKNNNAYHNTIKVKSVVKSLAHILTWIKKIIQRILNLKLVSV